jgi:hypothetical protein
MKVDAGDGACSMDHKIFWPPKPIVEFLYICIIEARSRCAYAGQECVVANDIRFSKRCSRLPVLPSAK